jgi:hypothetical protein
LFSPGMPDRTSSKILQLKDYPFLLGSLQGSCFGVTSKLNLVVSEAPLYFIAYP